MKSTENEKLLARLEKAEVEAAVARKLADKALDMAMDALVELKAMQKSTHKVELINPFGDQMPQAQQAGTEQYEDFLNDEDSEAVPQMPMSPFGLFARAQAQTAQKAQVELEKAVDDDVDAHWDKDVENVS